LWVKGFQKFPTTKKKTKISLSRLFILIFQEKSLFFKKLFLLTSKASYNDLKVSIKKGVSSIGSQANNLTRSLKVKIIDYHK